MKIADWLWCKWNDVCPKHRREKQSSLGSSHCEDCLSEWFEKYQEKRQFMFETLKIKKATKFSWES